jgi:rhodanese-related sulfurtransferase
MAKTITASEFIGILASDPATQVLDVRTPAEHQESHLAASCCHLPLDQISAANLRQRFPATDKPLYILCKGGVRAAKAAEFLSKEGFTQAIVVEGGLDACITCGADVAGEKSAILPLERQVRVAAGAVVLLGLALGVVMHPFFYWLSAFAGGGLIFAGLSGWCGMALLLAKAPWNK